jgi:hypothetical protein
VVNGLPGCGLVIRQVHSSKVQSRKYP